MSFQRGNHTSRETNDHSEVPAEGEAQQSQAFNFSIGKTTVPNIVRETCEAILKEVMLEMYLKITLTMLIVKLIVQGSSNTYEAVGLCENSGRDWNLCRTSVVINFILIGI